MSTSDAVPPNVLHRVIKGPVAGTALLGCMAMALAPSASAQFPSSVDLANGSVTGTFNLAGLTLTNISCASSTSNCGSLMIETVSVGRGKVELEIVNQTTTSPIFSLASNKFSAGADTLTVDYTVTTDLPKSAKVSGTQLTLNVANTGSWTATSNAGWSQTDSLTPGPVAIAINSGTFTTQSDAQANFTTPGTSDIISANTITLNNAKNSGLTLTLNSGIQEYFITPEPASIGAFLIGLGGLATIRRRRQQ